MKKQNLLLFTATVFLCTTSTLLSGDVTRSFYFGRAAFGAGSTSTISSCNTGSTSVVERVIFGSSGKWGGGDVVGTFRIPNLLPVRLSI